jgi:hypothetical protein
MFRFVTKTTDRVLESPPFTVMAQRARHPGNTGMIEIRKSSRRSPQSPADVTRGLGRRLHRVGKPEQTRTYPAANESDGRRLAVALERSSSAVILADRLAGVIRTARCRIPGNIPRKQVGHGQRPTDAGPGKAARTLSSDPNYANLIDCCWVDSAIRPSRWIDSDRSISRCRCQQQRGGVNDDTPKTGAEPDRARSSP